MPNFQLITDIEIIEMLKQRNLWSRLHSNKLLAKEQATGPAKISNGISSIISYYDEHLQYVCTIHRITTEDGKIIHEHVKDAYIDGVRYKAK